MQFAGRLTCDGPALLLQGCYGRYKGNSIAGNGRGSVSIDALADVDVDAIELDNKLDKPTTLL
jgi:hypothetical protein